jgi:hypothetical protein
MARQSVAWVLKGPGKRGKRFNSFLQKPATFLVLHCRGHIAETLANLSVSRLTPRAKHSWGPRPPKIFSDLRPSLRLWLRRQSRFNFSFHFWALRVRLPCERGWVCPTGSARTRVEHRHQFATIATSNLVRRAWQPCSSAPTRSGDHMLQGTPCSVRSTLQTRTSVNFVMPEGRIDPWHGILLCLSGMIKSSGDICP